MEAAIIFHFAGRGDGSSRLALLDFAQLLNPKWKAPQSQFQEQKEDKHTTVLTETLRSMYNFGLGGRFPRDDLLLSRLGNSLCGCQV